jgi:dipeptidase
MIRPKPRSFLAACVLAAVLLVLGPAFPLSGCSTIVVGKKASPTGRVLLGHNEDNAGRLIMVSHLVPAMKHAPGETILFEEGRAALPRAAETGALLWSETVASWKPAFSDSYVNEWGVAAVSNSCWPSREDRDDLTQGGVGYGLLRTVSEQARTARQAVDLAARLLDAYGYYDSGRTYVFADKDEGWFLEVVRGRHYVAERVPDDEVAFIPNHYTVHGVDPRDGRNFVVSPGLVEYAQDRGWYEPVQDGSSADFDFARAFGSGSCFDGRWSATADPALDNSNLRHARALEILTGRSWAPTDPFPFALKPARPVGPEEIKAILRSHAAGAEDVSPSASPSGTPHSAATICGSETQESLVVEFRADPRFTVVERTAGRPCTSPYVPWYLGLRSLPDVSGAGDPDAALRDHFSPAATDLGYDPDKAWWSFIDLQNLLEPQYLQGTAVADWTGDIRAFETESLAGEKAVEAKAASLLARDAGAARDVLTRFTHERARAARDLAREAFQRLAAVKLKITTPEIRRGSSGGILLAALLSSPDFDARQVDPATVILGPGYVQTDRWVKGSGLLRDSNDDGRLDLVIAFPATKLLELLGPGKCDLWLSGRTRQGRVFVARDFLNVTD